MALTPKKIYKDYKSNKLDKGSAADLLIYIIENSTDIEHRLNSIKTLERIENTDKKIFTILESLLISESDIQIRLSASHSLKVLFGVKALAPLEWALEHINSLNGSIAISSMIAEIDDDNTKKVLINRLKNLQDLKFMKSTKQLFEIDTIYNLSNKELADILNNYFVIKYIKQNITKFEYQIDRGFVTLLDLSNTNCWEILKRLSGMISILNKLEKLTLKSSKLGSFPTSIGMLTHLNHLDLSYNYIKKIPESINSLNSLKHLYLNNNKLKELPNSIGSLKLLEILNLRHNDLITLPHSFSKLHSLIKLDLHGNSINRIPKCLTNLSSLETLNLGVNNISEIPKWIKKITTLKKLGLTGNNNLFNLNEWIEHLPPLKVLNLTNVGIKTLPHDLQSLDSLEELILNSNQLETLPDPFRSLTSLKKLDLGWNNFTSLPDWIGVFINLEELNLSGNKFKTLPESMGFLSSLKILKIESNMDKIVLPESITRLKYKDLKIYQ